MFKLFDGVYLSSASDAELTTWCREGVPFTEAELPVLDALAAAREYFLKGLSSDAHEDRVDYFGRGEHALSVAHCRAGDFTHLSDKIREEFDQVEELFDYVRHQEGIEVFGLWPPEWYPDVDDNQFWCEPDFDE